MTNKTHNKDDRIRVRAYHLWESAGRPHGDDQAHWHAAAHEEESVGEATPAAKRRRSKAAATASPATRRPRSKTST